MADAFDTGAIGKALADGELNLLQATHLALMDTEKLEMIRSTGERQVTLNIKRQVGMGLAEVIFAPIGFANGDTIVYNLQLRRWFADIVVFHTDGSATVVEVKDGMPGLVSVLGGIGQVGLYATVLAGLGGVKTVRRALLWTPVTSAAEDANQMVSAACKVAGVVPIYLPSVNEFLLEEVKTLINVLYEASEAMRHG